MNGTKVALTKGQSVVVYVHGRLTDGLVIAIGRKYVTISYDGARSGRFDMFDQKISGSIGGSGIYFRTLEQEEQLKAESADRKMLEAYGLRYVGSPFTPQGKRVIADVAVFLRERERPLREREQQVRSDTEESDATVGPE